MQWWWYQTSFYLEVEWGVRYFNLAGTGSFEFSRLTEKGVLVGSSGRTRTGVGERSDSRPMLTEDDLLVCSKEIVYRT